MTPERWTRIKALFSAATEIPIEERASFLASEAGDDAALIAEVNSLLHSHDTAGDFLATVPAELRKGALFIEAASAGERIGAYRLVEILGTGGMGDVYRAVRDDDQYRAEVAIKLMRADMRNPLSEQRFKNERQILAALDHRNIARLLDGGTTTQGLPYVVMELVAGEPIDRYCDARSLSAHDRVRLFLQVCAAVSFAHQHLVVHRDLKPNNILVTADGSVKLLDFGIAKLIEPDAITGTNTEETRTQLRAMTLEYASPEQVSGGTVTTVSDVYSLGVVLYRLLTGQSPYGKRASNDAQRMAEILSDTAPVRPSQLKSTTREPIDADLDHILLMSLRKEPAKRYGSVEQFANDLRNHLNGLPVAARRGTFGYRLGKLFRRHRVPIAAATIVIASLVGGLGLAIHEARIAEQQRVIAQRHFDSVRKLATRLFDFHDEIAQLPGSTRAREMLVTTSLEYLDTLYKESGNDLALQEELAVAYKKVGDIQGNTQVASLGDSAGAHRSYANAIALLERLRDRDPKNVRIGSLLAKSYYPQTRRILTLSGAKDALPVAEKSIALCEAMQSMLTDEYEAMGLLGNSLSNHAEVLGALGRLPESRASLNKMISVAEGYVRDHPSDPRGLTALGSAYNNASVFGAAGLSKPEAYAWSASLLEKAMAVDEALLALKPDDAAYRWSLAGTRVNLGNLYYDNGEFARAVDMHRKAAAVFAIRDPRDMQARLVNAMNDVALAIALAKIGPEKEAEAMFAAGEKSLLEIQSHGEDLQIDYNLANIKIRRGEMYLEQSRREEACLYVARGLAQLEKVEKAIPGDKGVADLLAAGKNVLDRCDAVHDPTAP